MQGVLYSEETVRETGRPGKRSRRAPISLRAARTTAQQLINDGLMTDVGWKAILTLSVAGSLTTVQLRQLGVSLRSLQRFHREHFVDYLIASDNLRPLNFPKAASLRDLRVWKLGMVGEAIANEREANPIVYSSAYRLKQIDHDVCVAEVAKRFFLEGKRRGWAVEWQSKNHARLYREVEAQRQGRIKQLPYLEPDSLIIMRKQDKVRAFSIEHHHEKDTYRIKDKVQKYEEANTLQKWQEWSLNFMPVVVISHRADVVGKGYAEAVRNLGQGRKCHYITAGAIQTWAGKEKPPEFKSIELMLEYGWGEAVINPFESADSWRDTVRKRQRS